MADALEPIDPKSTTRDEPAADATVERDEHLEQPGITGKAMMTGIGIAAEGVAALKVAGSELLDIADALAFTTFDTADDLAEQFTGPRLAAVAMAPTKVARAAYRAGSVSTRRVLTLA